MHLFDIDSDNVHEFINSVGPIRVECYIEFYSKDSDTIKKGTIFRSTYTDRNKKNKRNHIFIIKNEDGSFSDEWVLDEDSDEIPLKEEDDEPFIKSLIHEIDKKDKKIKKMRMSELRAIIRSEIKKILDEK